MSLIKCPECASEVSNILSNCSKCGYPFNAKQLINQSKIQAQKHHRISKLKNNENIIYILMFVVVFVILVIAVVPVKRISEQVIGSLWSLFDKNEKKAGEIAKTSVTAYYIATTTLNVRSAAGSEYPVLFTLKTGEEVAIISQGNDWYKIQYNGQTGYTSSKYLKFARNADLAISNELSRTEKKNSNYLILVGLIIGVIILIILLVRFGKRDSQPQANPSSMTLIQQQSKTKVIVTKSTKSVGITILLVLLFGPMGMFYSTIGGALFMSILFPIVLFVLFLNGNWGYMILLAIIFYPICMIWAGNAVKNYNRKIMR